MTRIGAAVLAAGASRRLGRPKQLLIHRGKPLVRAAVECVCAAQVSVRAVVLGSSANEVRAVLADCRVDILENSEWEEGMASSIRRAIDWADAQRCDALLLLLCDQPQLDAEHLNRLIAEHAQSRLPVASIYAGKCGVPALFPRSWFAKLGALQGDSGASRLLNAGGPLAGVPWPEGEFDIDSVENARRLLVVE